jgi:hypothetical protein
VNGSGYRQGMRTRAIGKTHRIDQHIDAGPGDMGQLDAIGRIAADARQGNDELLPIRGDGNGKGVHFVREGTGDIEADPYPGGGGRLVPDPHADIGIRLDRPGAVVRELDPEVPIFAVQEGPGQLDDDGIRPAQLFIAGDRNRLVAIGLFPQEHVGRALGIPVPQAVGGSGPAARIQVDGEIVEGETGGGQGPRYDEGDERWKGCEFEHG